MRRIPNSPNIGIRKGTLKIGRNPKEEKESKISFLFWAMLTKLVRYSRGLFGRTGA
jgi:hypothetical protein